MRRMQGVVTESFGRLAPVFTSGGGAPAFA